MAMMIADSLLLNIEKPLDDRGYFVTKEDMKKFSIDNTHIINGQYMFSNSPGNTCYCLEEQSHFYFNSRNADGSVKLTLDEARNSEYGYWSKLELGGGSLKVNDVKTLPTTGNDTELYLVRDVTNPDIKEKLYVYSTSGGFIKLGNDIATKDEAGIVKIGLGIEIDTDGTISLSNYNETIDTNNNTKTISFGPLEYTTDANGNITKVFLNGVGLKYVSTTDDITDNSGNVIGTSVTNYTTIGSIESTHETGTYKINDSDGNEIEVMYENNTDEYGSKQESSEIKKLPNGTTVVTSTLVNSSNIGITKIETSTETFDTSGVSTSVTSDVRFEYDDPNIRNDFDIVEDYTKLPDPVNNNLNKSRLFYCENKVTVSNTEYNSGFYYYNFTNKQYEDPFASKSNLPTTSKSITSNIEVGGVEENKTYTAGTNLENIVFDIINKHKAPDIKIELNTPHRCFEVGDTIQSLVIDADVTRQSADIAKIEFFINDTVIETKDTSNTPDIANSKLYSYLCNIQITDTSTIKVVVTDVNGDTNEDLIKLQFVRKVFYDALQIESTLASSDDVRNLTQSEYIVTNDNGEYEDIQLNINIPINTATVVIAVPDSIPVQSIKYVEGMNLDVTNLFSISSVSVEGMNGHQSINYTVYQFTPVVPFDREVNYIVTI